MQKIYSEIADCLLVTVFETLLTLNLLVLCHARDEVASEQKVDNVHLVTTNEAFRVSAYFQWAEPLEKCLD